MFGKPSTENIESYTGVSPTLFSNKLVLTRWPVVVRLESKHHLEPRPVELRLESRLPRFKLEVLLSPAPECGVFIVDEKTAVPHRRLAVA